MVSEYKFNNLMRQIIKRDFNGNQSAFARHVGWIRSQVQQYHSNNRRMGFQTFRYIAHKCGYNLKITISKKK